MKKGNSSFAIETYWRMRNNNVLEVPVNHHWSKGRDSKVGTACVCQSRL